MYRFREADRADRDTKDPTETWRQNTSCATHEYDVAGIVCSGFNNRSGFGHCLGFTRGSGIGHCSASTTVQVLSMFGLQPLFGFQQLGQAWFGLQLVFGLQPLFGLQHLIGLQASVRTSSVRCSNLKHCSDFNHVLPIWPA